MRAGLLSGVFEGNCQVAAWTYVPKSSASGPANRREGKPGKKGHQEVMGPADEGDAHRWAMHTGGRWHLGSVTIWG